MLKAKSRLIVSLVISILTVVYLFNFVPRDIAIIASRTPARQVLDYTLNFVIFFVAVYLLLTLLAFVTKKVFPHSK